MSHRYHEGGGRARQSRGAERRPGSQHHGGRFEYGEFYPGVWGSRGWGRPRRRRGDVRAGVLGMLAEQPMHGYQIIQQLEERSGGVWRPSAGSVYPMLQLLEDQGLVRSEEIEGRRVYSLTGAGRAEAEAAKERNAGVPPWADRGSAGDDPRARFSRVFFQLGAAVRQIALSGSEEQNEKALQILAEARRKLYGLLADDE